MTVGADYYCHLGTVGVLKRTERSPERRHNFAMSVLTVDLARNALVISRRDSRFWDLAGLPV